MNSSFPSHRVLALMPHPDDIEILCAGTLLRLREEAGCELHLVTMTAGDKGSATHTSAEIGAIRRAEAEAAARSLGAASYSCLDFHDLEIVFDNVARRRVTQVLREVDPFLVITTPPQDYMFDHEITSQLVRDACFNASVPLYADSTPATSVPYLYYSDAIEGHDLWGAPSRVSCIVDISSQIEAKSRALMCHDSQRSWLHKQHGMDNYIESMKSWSAQRGEQIGVNFAEAFGQHLGHPHPQDDILAQMLDAVPSPPSP